MIGALEACQIIDDGSGVVIVNIQIGLQGRDCDGLGAGGGGNRRVVSFYATRIDLCARIELIYLVKSPTQKNSLFSLIERR